MLQAYLVISNTTVPLRAAHLRGRQRRRYTHRDTKEAKHISLLGDLVAVISHKYFRPIRSEARNIVRVLGRLYTISLSPFY